MRSDVWGLPKSSQCRLLRGPVETVSRTEVRPQSHIKRDSQETSCRLGKDEVRKEESGRNVSAPRHNLAGTVETLGDPLDVTP